MENLAMSKGLVSHIWGTVGPSLW